MSKNILIKNPISGGKVIIPSTENFSVPAFNLTPQSADPVDSVIGTLQYADGTVRSEGLWEYKSTGWAQAGGSTGTAGLQGVTGIIGSTGIQGIQGTTGILGIQGVTGIIGSTGIQGIQGTTGILGINGVTGIQGVTGIIGSTGIQGIQGVTGIIGSTGIQGVTGIIGSTGIQGIQGVTGIIGSTGIQGIQGVTGIQGSNGSVGAQGSTGVQGIQGTGGSAGSQGNTGIQGVTGIRGSGMTLMWRNDDTLSCGEVTSFGQLAYTFTAGDTQNLYASMKVPASWAGGTQINLKLKVYSPTGSGTVLLQSVATLINSSSSSLADTTNQHNSNNTSQNITVANKEYLITLDITDSSGHIGTPAVVANDTIIIYVTRGSDTNTDLAYVMPSTMEIIV